MFTSGEYYVYGYILYQADTPQGHGVYIDGISEHLAHAKGQ